MKSSNVVFFKRLRKEHLFKDIEMVREVLNVKNRCYILGYENEFSKSELEKLSGTVKTIKGKFNDRFSFLKSIVSILSIRRSTKILCFIHVTKENLILTFFYKLFNKDSKVYIKSDINIDSFLTNGNSFWPSTRLNSLYKLILKNYVSCISAETHYGVKLIEDLVHSKGFNTHVKCHIRPNVFYLPNPSRFESHNSFEIEKKKVFLFVGRLGCEHKNVSLILNALNGMKLGDWKFRFVGPVINGFSNTISKFLIENPQLESNIEFLGPIYDSSKLIELYKESLYFVISSKSEGFPLSCVEAMSQGCVLILTPIYAAQDLIENNGYIYKNATELRAIFDSVINSQMDDLAKSASSREMYQKFCFSKFEDKLLNEL